MIDNDTVQRRLTAVAYAQAHAQAIGLACPVCTLQIAKGIDTFLTTGEVTGEHLDSEPEVEVVSDDNVTPFPRKPN
ncbi:hypothetical protein SAMN02983003_0636 [Devosia enhydra]|uniref:Uncharacterized protein n=1 Tax=Devosia enhydra TaxID=665118 RepID=A0A1K2HTU5_9HYPH|nr:hypothetical protein [Devosia enhydra]SFZ81691.1 hypothetical protein SAMN02983003_0636 [Devosia enhydra]